MLKAFIRIKGLNRALQSALVSINFADLFSRSKAVMMSLLKEVSMKGKVRQSNFEQEWKTSYPFESYLDDKNSLFSIPS